MGLFDSGLGGLSVLRAIRRLAPELPLAYVGDTARVPYGPRPRKEIVRFNLEISGALQAMGAVRLGVACNTSCALAMDALRAHVPLPMHGLIEAGAELALGLPEAWGPGGVGLVATEGTVRSGAYEEALQRRAPGLRVRALACPEWVPLVEAGLARSAQAQAAVDAALAPWHQDPPGVLILGCTHYPFLAEAIARCLGPGCALADPAEAMAQEILAAWGPVAPRTQADRLHATGDPEAFAKGAMALGIPLGEVRHLALPRAVTPA